MKSLRWLKALSLVAILSVAVCWYVLPRTIITPRRIHAAHVSPDAQTPIQHLEIEGVGGILLSGILVEPAGEAQANIILLHGISGSKEKQLGFGLRLAQRGIRALVVDHRAHGTSEGTYCTYGFYEKQDVSLWVEKMEALYPDESIGVWGHSLGGAIATQTLAIDQRLDFGIIESAFADLPTIVNDYQARIFGFPLPFIAAWSLDRAGEVAAFDPQLVSPATDAKEIIQPVLVVHGDADLHISAEYGKRIYEAIPHSRKAWIPIEGASHYDVQKVGGQPYFDRLVAFILSHRATQVYSAP
ncbi:alpha/beta fold hydrolase [Pontibacter sp. G13]|uniref:alpha/beta hydrolase n=1 Tax=Pontibacter sp. G13 TaxID=3074898 RepID=UPI00288C0079|nr:alpha/beta fold hydrolase [Pontibacter sp. G13]WNJ20812.1 alpha/beta fold hydrolase [Pontibacter sp. G13]